MDVFSEGSCVYVCTAGKEEIETRWDGWIIGPHGVGASHTGYGRGHLCVTTGGKRGWFVV